MAGSSQGFTRWLFILSLGPVFAPDEGGGDAVLASDIHLVVHRVMSSPNT